MQTALDRSAVYETVDVQSVNSLSGWTSCAVASWEEDEEEEEENHLKRLMLFYSIAYIHFKGKYYTILYFSYLFQIFYYRTTTPQPTHT